MKKIIFLVLIAFLLFGCEVRLQINSEEDKAMTDQETVEFFSENDVAGLAESFRRLEHFKYWSLMSWQSESYIFNVGFNQDVIIGVNEFQVYGDDLNDLQVKMLELYERLGSELEFEKEEENGVS